MIIYFLFVIFLFCGCFFTLKVYRRGINDGYKLYAKEPIIDNETPVEMTEEERQAEIIRSNIENYNGSAEGQVDFNL